MADGYARFSGRLGLCSVTPGQGLTNTATSLTVARLMMNIADLDTAVRYKLPLVRHIH